MDRKRQSEHSNFCPDTKSPVAVVSSVSLTFEECAKILVPRVVFFFSQFLTSLFNGLFCFI